MTDYAVTPQPMRPEDERLWATLVHIGTILVSWLVPLIGYLVLKDRGAFVRFHTAQALNFAISYLIYGFVAGLSVFLLVGFVLLPAVGVLYIVFGIIAAVKANAGEFYTIPLVIPFVR